MSKSAESRIPPQGSGSTPLYKRVKADILRRVSEGEWEPGEALPIEQELAAYYRVGIATVRAAIGELVAADIVDRIQGKGTFVSQHTRERDIYRFFHAVRDDGVKDMPRSELLSFEKMRADDAIADRLQLPRTRDGTWIFRMRNVLVVSGDSLIVSDITVPAGKFPGLSRKVIEEGGETIYAVYQRRYRINILRAPEKLKAVPVPADIAKILSLKSGQAVLQVDRTAYTFGQVPVEVRRSWVKTEGFHYFLDAGAEE